MIKLKLSKVIVSILLGTSILTLNPIRVNAAWKEDSTGWWFTEGNSWARGWRNINENWYYFYSDGYMAHDTIINGYYLDSDGVWRDSANGSINTLIEEAITKNICVQNAAFTIELPNGKLDTNNIKNIVENKIENLKITNPIEGFNISSYQYNITYSSLGNNKLTITCVYKITEAMMDDLNVKVNAIVESIAPNSMSDSEKERAIHDWIVNNTQYDESYTIYDPYNTLIKHKGVCEGYSLLAQKMFTAAGIKSMVIEGTADGQAHAWNIVCINNKWRHVDCTWDDPVSSRDILRYDYYNLTDDEISTDHTWDTAKYPKAN